ncbi:MAG: hypothetical protein A3K18_06495 [Lentisphaerae bacterium RIFOXYA12_64_32]|nr:MAG: hypothetical protein A3K18_06495 [Lentisphaerae bacterium RIFOXYA12_64_32]
MQTFPRLFVTDLDGTALGGGYQPYGRFPDHFSDFLDRLTLRGCQWAINSTWDVNGQWQLVLGSKVRSRPTFLMGSTGLRLATWAEDGPVSVPDFDRLMDARLEAVKQKSFYKLLRSLCATFDPRVVAFWGHWLHFEYYERDAERIRTFAARQDWAGMELLWELMANPARLIVYPAILGKDKNLCEALRISGIPPDAVVAAGDEPADIAMMQSHAAKYGLCPGNAHEKLKAHVAAGSGGVGRMLCCDGVMEAFNVLAQREKWDW